MIIGITGTNGGGKGAVVEYLVKAKGFTHFSARELILEEVKLRGLEPNRVNIGETATDMRRLNEANFISKTFIQRAQEQNAKDVVIESIRTLAESSYIQEHGGLILAVDAPVDVRYERVVKRGTSTDKVSFEDFRIQEDNEYSSKDPSDPVQMNVLGVMDKADYKIINNGTLEELHAQVDALPIF
jgi:dephospho-CoA kinase